MRRQRDDNEAIRARVAALPASWYAEQPIPPRLQRAIGAAMMGGTGREISRAEERILWVGRKQLSAVEQAHVRASNRLIRRRK